MSECKYTPPVTQSKTPEKWINNRWRPMMGWLYFATCVVDFIIFPVLWSLLQASADGIVTNQWSPMTLQGGGLFHAAMGAILGIAVYGRTQEKLCRINNGDHS